MLLCVVTLHMGLVAMRVYSAKDPHFHTWVHLQGGKPSLAIGTGIQPPFWPRYERCLVGIPWKGVALCAKSNGRLAEACQFGQPEIVQRTSSGRYQFRLTQDQADLINRLTNQSR